MRLIKFLIVMTVMLLAFSPLAFAETGTSNTTNTTATTTTSTSDRTDISAGVPEVTPDEFSGKVNRMSDAIYGTARSSIAAITVIVLVIGFIAGIFFEGARKMVGFAMLGLFVVLWAPQIVGYVIGIAKF